MTPGQVLLFAVGGLANAAYLFIVAAGLSLVFGALRVINMAHGSLYMIAAFVTVVIANQLGAGLGFWGGLLVAVAVTGAIRGIIEVLVLRRVYGREHLVQLLGTYAVSRVIGGGVRSACGANYRTVVPPSPGHLDVRGHRGHGDLVWPGDPGHKPVRACIRVHHHDRGSDRPAARPVRPA